jgi:hypothetical protein
MIVKPIALNFRTWSLFMATIGHRIGNKTRSGLLDANYELRFRTIVAASSFTKKGMLKRQRVRVTFHSDVDVDRVVIYTFCPEGYSGTRISHYFVQDEILWTK